MVEQQSQQNTVLLNNGYHMPLVGLGTWEQKNQESITVGLAEVGYRHLDCAAAYENEELVGKAIKDAYERAKVTGEHGLKREDIFVTTKLNLPDYTDPEKALRTSLEKLQLDYVDCYLIHWPAGLWNGKVPLHVLWGQLESLVEKKLTRGIGLSNFNIQLTADLLTYCKIKPICNQIELNPLVPQVELVKFLVDQGIQPVAYCPVAKAGADAFKTGRTQTITSPNLLEDPDVKAIAQKHGKTPLQVVLRWGLDRGHVVIPKATSKEHLTENFEVSTFKLTPEEVTTLIGKDQGLRICNKFGGIGDYDVFA